MTAKLQSAYRQNYSTETALLHVHNDIMARLHRKEMVALVLLDLSAAFDTIKHDILIQQLAHRFGIGGNVLAWLKSYLLDRVQRVSVNGCNSQPFKMGVPQGSVLGPILFTLYTSPLEEIIAAHGVDHHLYADDTQFYISLDESHSAQQLLALKQCISEIKMWMKSNFLQLNDDKTEFLLFGTKHLLKHTPSLDLTIGDTTITSSTKVKNLGAIFDSEMSMQNFVTAKCQCAMFHLRAISQIKHFLDSDSLRTLIQAFVISRIDYANSLLISANKSCIMRLQLVQNAAARLISRAKLRDHIKPILFTLHWLPVQCRFRFNYLF